MESKTSLTTKKSKVQTWKELATNWFSDNVRWYVLFGVVILSYVWIVYEAFVLKPKKGENEASETAMLVNPAYHGYNTIRGEPESPDNPPLFECTQLEKLWMTGIVLVSIYLFYYFWTTGKQKNEPVAIRVIQFILAWFHSVLLLLFIPINPFHKRMLYNGRAVMAQICNDPLKEFLLAFVFIVLLPLPGLSGTSYTQKMEWLALKVGVFYIVQSVLLGSPNYTIEPASENRILPIGTKDFMGYVALFGLGFMLMKIG